MALMRNTLTTLIVASLIAVGLAGCSASDGPAVAVSAECREAIAAEAAAMESYSADSYPSLSWLLDFAEWTDCGLQTAGCERIEDFLRDEGTAADGSAVLMLVAVDADGNQTQDVMARSMSVRRYEEWCTGPVHEQRRAKIAAMSDEQYTAYLQSDESAADIEFVSDRSDVSIGSAILHQHAESWCEGFVDGSFEKLSAVQDDLIAMQGRVATGRLPDAGARDVLRKAYAVLGVFGETLSICHDHFPREWLDGTMDSIEAVSRDIADLDRELAALGY